MQNIDDIITAQDSQGARSSEHRRKRVNRIKTIIIIIVVFLLIMPTIFCIFLGIQVNRLEKQMKVLMDLHSQYGLSYDSGDENLAYAAEKNKDFTQAGDTAEADDPSRISDGVNSGQDFAASDRGNNAGLSRTEGAKASNTADNPNAANASGIVNNPNAANNPNTANNAGTADNPNMANNPGAADNTDTANNPGTVNNTGTAGDTGITDDLVTTDDTGTANHAGTANGADMANKTGTGTSTDTKDGAGNSSGISGQASVKESGADTEKASDTDNGIYKGKKVYLTFDDGPSVLTDEILDTLADYNVKATFFVIGKTDTASKNLYKRIVDEGHTLGMHSYSHKYSKIYNSLEDFDKDFTKLWKLLYDTTGYKPSIYRFPGGSENLVNKNGMDEFIRYLNDKSFVYFDWNVVNGDATGVNYTEEQLIDNVLKGVAAKRTSIVLMHDAQSKVKTVESLPELLEKLISGGAEVLPLDKDVSPIQMIKADSIK